MTMNFQSQEGPQRKSYVVALRSSASRLASLNAAELFYPAMEVLYRPGFLRVLHSHKFVHCQIVGRPVFNVAICGYCLEDSDQPIFFEVHDLTAFGYFYLANGSIALAVRVHLPILFQARKPNPAETADQLEVIGAAVPAIKDYTSWLKSSLARFGKHLLKVIILGQPITSLVIDAIIARDVTVAVAPQQGDEIDATDHILVFARPVTAYKINLSSIGLVQSRIIKDEDARFAIDLLT